MHIEFQTLAASATPQRTPNLWTAHINLPTSGYLAVLFEPTCSRSLGTQLRAPSKRAFHVLTEQLLQEPETNPTIILDRIFSAIHERLIRSFPAKVSGTPSPDLVGVAALVWGDVLHIAHIGTARGYLVRDNALHPLTEDHSEAVAARKRTEIVQGTERGHPGYAVPTRMLGRAGQETAEIRRPGIPLATGDRFLLISTQVHGALTDEELQTVVLTEAKTTGPQGLITAARPSWRPEQEGGALVATCADRAEPEPRDDQITQKFVRDQLKDQLGPEAETGPDDASLDSIDIDLSDESTTKPAPRLRPDDQANHDGALGYIPARVRKRLIPALLAVALATLAFTLWVAWPPGETEDQIRPKRSRSGPERQVDRASAFASQETGDSSATPHSTAPIPLPVSNGPPSSTLPLASAPVPTAADAAAAAERACRTQCEDALRTLEATSDVCERMRLSMGTPWKACVENPDCAFEDTMRNRWRRLYKQTTASCDASVTSIASTGPQGLECETRKNAIEKIRIKSTDSCRRARLLTEDYKKLCAGVANHTPEKTEDAVGNKCFSMYQSECARQTAAVLGRVEDGKPHSKREAHQKLRALGKKGQACVRKEHEFGKDATQPYTDQYMAYKEALKDTRR